MYKVSNNEPAIELICCHLNKKDCFKFLSCCKRIYKRYKNNHFILTDQCKEESWLYAIKNNDLDWVNFLIYNKVPMICNNDYFLSTAAKIGNLEMIKLLCTYTDNFPFNFAARYGHLHVLKWLQKQNRFLSEWALIWAAEKGHTHIIKWIFENGYEFKDESIEIALEWCDSLEIKNIIKQY